MIFPHHKSCPMCGGYLHISMFGRRPSGALYSYCLACHRQQAEARPFCNVRHIPNPGVASSILRVLSQLPGST